MVSPPSPGSAGEGARRSGRADEGAFVPAPADPPSVPCATPNLDPSEVWSAILTAASEKMSLHTLISPLQLVSLTPERAVVGHAPRDRMSAEMALGHLNQLFERTLGRRIAVSIMQVKDAPTPTTAPASPTPSEPRPSGSGPTPSPAQRTPAPAFAPRPVPSPSPDPVPQRPATAPSRALSAAEIDAAKANPLVVRAGELLNAKVVRINARPDAPKPNQPPTT